MWTLDSHSSHRAILITLVLANPPGFVRGSVMRADDGVTVVGAFIFESKEAYIALADNPDQAQWYGEVVAPMLDGEAAWIDGHWTDNE